MANSTILGRNPLALWFRTGRDCGAMADSVSLSRRSVSFSGLPVSAHPLAFPPQRLSNPEHRELEAVVLPFLSQFRKFSLYIWQNPRQRQTLGAQGWLCSLPRWEDKQQQGWIVGGLGFAKVSIPKPPPVETLTPDVLQLLSFRRNTYIYFV